MIRTVNHNLLREPTTTKITKDTEHTKSTKSTAPEVRGGKDFFRAVAVSSPRMGRRNSNSKERISFPPPFFWGGVLKRNQN
jgi:hypothetical protein